MIMESRTKQFEQISNLLANSNTFYVNIIDTDGNYVFVNKLFEKRFGQPNNKLEKTSLMDVLHHDDVEQCAVIFRQMQEHKIRMSNLELRLKLPDKLDVVWTSWEIAVVENQEKEVEGIICIGSDIVRKDSVINSRLLSYSKRIDKILNSITDGFFTLDKDWRITKVNQLFEQLSKKPRSQLLGKIFWEEYPEYAYFLKNPAYLNAIEKNEAFQFEFFSESRQMWFSVKVYPSSEGIVVFFQNITENKEHIEEIVQKNKILTEIARLQSHQVRRPVATILGLSQLFDKKQMGDENLELLDMLEKTILELDEIIHKIVHKANSVIKKSKTKPNS